MKQTGSKIAVLIIVIAMVFLASVLFDTTNTSLKVTKDDDTGPKIYEEEMKINELASTSLVFEEFVYSDDKYTGELSEIDYGKHPLAKNFESIIQSTYESVGINFANKYSVISWSCGEDCQNSIIIDAISGEIVEYGIISANGLSFSPTSRLLVINPKDAIKQDDTIATDYYIVDDEGSLNLIAKMIYGENLIHACLKATTTARNIITNIEEEFESVCRVPYGWEIISL